MIEIERNKLEEIYKVLSSKIDEKLPPRISFFIYKNIKNFDSEIYALDSVRKKLILTERIHEFNMKITSLINEYTQKYGQPTIIWNGEKEIPHFGNKNESFVSEMNGLRIEYNEDISNYEAAEKELNELLMEKINVEVYFINYVEDLSKYFSVRELLIIDELIEDNLETYAEVNNG